MIEHLERFPRIRDRAIFVGEPADVVPGTFGPGLPRDPGLDQASLRLLRLHPGARSGVGAGPRDTSGAVRLGPAETICVVAVGGTAVGAPLLGRAVQALPAIRERVADLRMIAVAGPRIDPDSLPASPGLELRGYVHALHRELAACDVAIVQGGLTTGMELIAAGTPFVSIPLARHFEQRRHVRHRLERYGATVSLDYADATPDALADAMLGVLSRPGRVSTGRGRRCLARRRADRRTAVDQNGPIHVGTKPSRWPHLFLVWPITTTWTLLLANERPRQAGGPSPSSSSVRYFGASATALAIIAFAASASSLGGGSVRCATGTPISRKKSS
jgi:hypothetical protein